MADEPRDVWAEEHAGQVKPDPQIPTQHDQDIVQEAVDFHALVTEVESVQRAREAEEIEFEAGEQWKQEDRESRRGGEDESGTIRPRSPAMTINLVEMPVEQVMSEVRQARLTTTVKPKGRGASQVVADKIKGVMRLIDRESGALPKRVWAVRRAAVCGRGAYRVDTAFANDTDFDVDVVIKRFLDQSTVFLDPYAVNEDYSDGMRALIAEEVEVKERLRRWPDKPLGAEAEGLFSDNNNTWFRSRDGRNYVTIGTFFKVTFEERNLVYHQRYGSMLDTDMAKMHGGVDALREVEMAMRDGNDTWAKSRKVEVRRIKIYVLDGTQILEEHDWDGRYIPIIPTIGKEKVVRGRRFYFGIISSTMDSQRGFNVSMSSAVELAGMMPRSPYIMAEGQEINHEEEWQQSAIKRFVFLLYKPTSLEGQLVPPPQRANMEPQLQSALLLAEAFKNHIGSMTGIVDPAFRSVNPYDRSGRAIDLLQRQGSSGTSIYIDNLATITLPYESKVKLDLIAKIYDTPGRVVRVPSDLNDTETAFMIKQPYVVDDDGEPQPVPCPTCQGAGFVRQQVSLPFSASLVGVQQTCPTCRGGKLATKETMPEMWQDKPVEYVDFSEGEYSVEATVSRSYQSKSEEAVGRLMELGQTAPQLVPLYADLLVRSLHFPYSDEIADRIRSGQPIGDLEDQVKNIPRQARAQFMQLMQQHQQAMQQLQAAEQIIQSSQVESQAKKDIEAMKIEAQAGLEHLKEQSKVFERLLEERHDRQQTILQASIQEMMQQSEQRHEVLLQLLQERGEKEVERHSVELRKEAERQAGRQLEE